MQESIGDVEFPCRSSTFSNLAQMPCCALKACRNCCCLLDIPLEVWWSLDRDDPHSVKLLLKNLANCEEDDPVSKRFRELWRSNNQEGASISKRGTRECIIGARIRCLAGDEMDRDAAYEYLSQVLSPSAAQQGPELNEYRVANVMSEEEPREGEYSNAKNEVFSSDSENAQGPISVNVEELSATVVKVSLEPLLEILVLGTSHDDKSSVVDVRNELAPTKSKMDSVVVELDETRMQLMETRENEKTHLVWYLIFRVLPALFYFLVCLVTKSRDLEMWREVLWDFYLFYITPGGGGFGLELVEAVRIGRRNQLDVVFGDMEMTNAYHSRAFFTPLHGSKLRSNDDSNDSVSSEIDDDVEQGLLQDKARHSQRRFENTDEHVLSGDDDQSSADPAKVNSSSLTPEDVVLRQVRGGELGLLKGSTLVHSFAGKDTSERDVRLAFAALFEASGRKRLVVVGLAHVVGIVHILQRLLNDLVKDKEVDSLLSIDRLSEEDDDYDTGDGKLPIGINPSHLMRNWMILRRGNRLRIAKDQLRALIGFNDILNDLPCIRTLSQRFMIRSGCLVDTVIALEQHKDQSERDGDSSRRIIRSGLKMLLDLWKQWSIVDVNMTKGKSFIQRLKSVLTHIQVTDGALDGDEQCSIRHQTMTILNEIPHGS